MQKVILIICDGIGDRPIPKLGRKTPLEAANTPNLDLITKKGISGAMHTIDIGVRPGSDTAHLSLFGYDPNVYYAGRGPYETAGIGMSHKPGDICFRVNMATVNEKMIVTDRRAGRLDDTSEYANLFDGTTIEGVTFMLKKATAYRLGLIMRGKGLSSAIEDVDPHWVDKPAHKAMPKDKSPEAKRTADILNKFLQLVREKLKSLPSNKERLLQGLPQANYMLVRGAGTYPDLPSFQDKYHLNAACFAGAGLYKGIARVLGMKVYSVPGATGKPDSNIRSKIDMVIKHLNDHEFFYVHFKGADSMGEDGNVEGKIAYIEKIDKAVAPLLKLKDAIVIITADHSTPCTIKNHSADDVPIVIMSEEARDDDNARFTERACAKGRLGHIKGEHLMPITIDLMGLAEKFGA